MEIKNYTNAVSSYKAIAFEKTVREKPLKTPASKNTDKVELFSSKPTSIQGLKASIARSVESSINADKLSSLKSAVSSGEYSISSESLSNSIVEI